MHQQNSVTLFVAPKLCIHQSSMPCHFFQVGVDVFSVVPTSPASHLHTSSKPGEQLKQDVLCTHVQIQQQDERERHTPCMLRGLNAKKLGSPATAVQQLASNVDNAYEVVWQASEPQGPHDLMQAPVPEAHLQPSASAVAACLAGLQLLQRRVGPLGVHGEGAAMEDAAFGGLGGDQAGRQTVSLWGLIKSVVQENPAHALQLLSTQPQNPGALSVAATARFHGQQYANEYGMGRVSGATRTPLLALSGTRQEVPFSFYLDCMPKGSLENLAPVPVSIDQQRGRLCLQAHAVGLNFRDLLNVLVRAWWCWFA